jgi:hypothetical protein
MRQHGHTRAKLVEYDDARKRGRRQRLRVRNKC